MTNIQKSMLQRANTMKRFLYLVATDQIKGGVVAIVQVVLWILSQAYGFCVALRGAFYKVGIFKHHQLSCPVISVGNLTVGGVGKTPLVELIARALREKGVGAAILTRGYMGEGVDARGQSSDEAVMLENVLSNVPILVGADRIKSAKAHLAQNKVGAFLLDDGFQHWRLSRDVDIVAIDATNPWGNGCLLPRGILREGKKALLRAHIFVLTKVDLGREHAQNLKDDLKLINPKALIVEAVHQPVALSDMRFGEVVDLASVRGQKICAVCSIGAPDSFTKTLVKLGADVGGQFAFMDHHRYARDDVQRIVQSCQEGQVKTVVTTEKDAVKLKSFLEVFPESIRVLSLRIKVVIVNGEDAFLERIHRVL